MSISIPNAGQQRLSALVQQMDSAGVKDSDHLRGEIKKDGTIRLYSKPGYEDKSPSAKVQDGRTKTEAGARAAISLSLREEFPRVADKVLKNMSSFFEGTGQFNASTVKDILKNAQAEAAYVPTTSSRYAGRMEQIEQLDLESQRDGTRAQANAIIARDDQAQANAIIARDARAAEVNSPGAVHRLLDTQGSPGASRAFLAMLNREHSNENYLFVQEVKVYQTLPSTTQAERDQKQTEAASIVTQFGKDINTKTVPTMKDFDAKNQAAVDTFFDNNVNEITFVLEKDAVPRFLKSPEARNYINNG